MMKTYKYLIGGLSGRLPIGRKYDALVQLAGQNLYKLLDESSIEAYVGMWKIVVENLNKKYPRSKPWSVEFCQRELTCFHYLRINCPGYDGCYIALIVIRGEWDGCCHKIS